MQRLKSIFDFYISSSIHVALAVSSLSYLTLLRYNLPLDINLLVFIFFASITGYNFVKYFGLAKFHHRSLAKRLKFIQVFSLICFVLMVYFVFQLDIATIILLSVFALITFLYAVPILPTRLFMDETQKLRSVSGLKVYLIALIWSGVTVILPLTNADTLFDVTVVISFVQRFMFVLALMLPFEIRDLNYDSLKLATIPQRIGVRYTKLMGCLLLAGMCLLEIISPLSSIKSLTAVGLVATISAIFVSFSRIDQNRYYSGFFVEAIPILWLLLAMIL